MSMLSAAQASLLVRWETMDTMVCSIFSGASSDARDSTDLLWVPLPRESHTCSPSAAFIPESAAPSEMLVAPPPPPPPLLGSTTRGVIVAADCGVRLSEVSGSAEIKPGADLSSPRAAIATSGEEGCTSVWRFSQVSGFLELGEAS